MVYQYRQPLKDHGLIQSDLFILSDSFLQIGEIDSAIQIEMTKFKNDQSVLDISNIRKDTATFYSYGSHSIYERLGEIYYKKFQRSKEYTLLHTAAELYNLADSALLKDMILSINDNESLLRHLLLAHRIYSEAIDVQFHLYQKNEQPTHALKAAQYMNKLKGVLQNKNQLNSRVNKEREEIQNKIRELRIGYNVPSKKLLTSYINTNHKYNKEEVIENLIHTHIQPYQLYELCRKYKSTIVEYHLSDELLYKLRISNNQVKIFQSKYPIQLQEKVNNQTFCLANNKSDECEDFSYLNKEYWDIIFKDAVKDGDSSIIIIPDGSLNYFPFEFLQRDSIIALKKYSIRYSTSKNSLLNYMPKHDTIRNINSIFSYSFSNKESILSAQSKNTYNELPGSILDQKFLSKNYNKETTTLYSGKLNRTDILKRLNKYYDVIIFSTHANSSIDNRLESYIVINSTESEEKKIYGHELKNLESKLVLLLTCNSSRGTLIRGEGLSSLNHFVLNGKVNNTIVSSLGCGRSLVKSIYGGIS